MPLLTGFKWPSPNVSVSYVPDGTMVMGYPSNLFALYNAQYQQWQWQNQIDRALKTWEAASGLVFRYVSDDGSNQGVPAPPQNDPRFGDIRIAASKGVQALDSTQVPDKAGAVLGLNGYTAMGLTGTGADLYSVVLHSLGGSLGLAENQPADSVMNGPGPFVGLYPIDIEGIQMLYGPPPVSPPIPLPAPLPASLMSVASRMMHGVEYYNGVVISGYHKYLGRTPSPQEIAPYINELLRHKDEAAFLAELLGSREYWTLKGSQKPLWVAAVYEQVFGRTPSAGEIAQWVSQL